MESDLYRAALEALRRRLSVTKDEDEAEALRAVIGRLTARTPTRATLIIELRTVIAASGAWEGVSELVAELKALLDRR